MAFDAATYEAPVIDPLTLTTPRARLEYVRDFLRELPAERFDMRHPGDTNDYRLGECKTPACIGGWLVAKFRYTRRYIGGAGRDLFGLSENDARRLFYPLAFVAAEFSPYDASPKQAAQVLDHLLTTGKVDWSVAKAGA